LRDRGLGTACRDSASPSTLTAASLILCVVTAIFVALLFSTYTLADGGSDVYKMRCAACHGANGAGQTMIGKNLKLRSLTSPEVQNQSDEQLEAVVRQGKNKNKMPAFDRRLSKEQIAAVVKYIRLLKN
jgi:cytochrome c6